MVFKHARTLVCDDSGDLYKIVRNEIRTRKYIDPQVNPVSIFTS